ncbi:MAG: YkvA family protein [Bacillota bacterium]|jgi:uncharacterized membrane protein YkvA (DUF1232 family)
MEREIITLEEPQVLRFYDRLRTATVDWAAQHAGILGGALVNLLLLAPDVFILLWRLQQRSEVPRRHRLLFLLALTYFISPADLVPDWVLGPLGFADDLMLATAVLRAAFVNTPMEVLLQEWSGNQGLIAVLSQGSRLADRLLHFPLFRPVKRLIRFLI